MQRGKVGDLPIWGCTTRFARGTENTEVSIFFIAVDLQSLQTMAEQAHTDEKEKNFRRDSQDHMDKNNDRLKAPRTSVRGGLDDLNQGACEAISDRNKPACFYPR